MSCVRHIVREDREVRLIRESWEGKGGTNIKGVNVKSFHYFEKMLQIIRKIFGLAVDDFTSQIYIILTYKNFLQEFLI
jgi:hypothetical protein